MIKKIIILILALFLMSCSSKIQSNIQMNNQYYSDGLKLLESGQYEEAILSFEKAIEIDDKNVNIYHSLASAYYETGNISEVANVLNQGYEITGDESLKNHLNSYLVNMDFINLLNQYDLIPKVDLCDEVENDLLLSEEYITGNWFCNYWEEDNILDCSNNGYLEDESILYMKAYDELYDNPYYSIDKYYNYIQSSYNDEYICFSVIRNPHYEFEKWREYFGIYERLDAEIISSFSIEIYYDKYCYDPIYENRDVISLTFTINSNNICFEMIDGMLFSIYFNGYSINGQKDVDEINDFNKTLNDLKENIKTNISFLEEMSNYIKLPVNNYINLSEVERLIMETELK